MASRAADPASASDAPWHGYLLGNATEPLLYVVYALLAFCVLSGKWWLMLYVITALVLFGITLMYGLYLEYNAQAELERRYKEQMRFKQRWGQRT